MAISSYDKPSEFKYIPMPFDAMLKGAAYGREQQNAQLKEIGEMGDLSKAINPAFWEKDKAMQYQKNFSSKIGELANKVYSGQATPQEIFAQKKALTDDLLYGEGAQLNNTGAKYAAQKKALDEALERGRKGEPGGITLDDYNNILNKDISPEVIAGTKEYQPSQFEGDPGIYKDVEDLMDKLRKEKTSVTTVNDYLSTWQATSKEDPTLMQQRKDTFKKAIEANDRAAIQQILNFHLSNNPKYQGYLNQKASLEIDKLLRNGQIDPTQVHSPDSEDAAFYKTLSKNPNLNPNSPEFQQALAEERKNINLNSYYQQAKQNYINNSTRAAVMSAGLGTKTTEEHTFDVTNRTNVTIEDELKNNNTKSLKDKLFIRNEGGAVTLTPEEYNTSKDNLRILNGSVINLQKELKEIETAYGEDSRQYVTKQEELKQKTIEAQNAKSTIDGIDNQMENSSLKVDYDKLYKDYQSSFTGVGGDLSPLNKTPHPENLLTKEEYINYIKNFNDYKEEYTTRATAKLPANKIFNEHNYRQLLRDSNIKEERTNKYLKENKIAYAVQPLTGQEGSTVDDMNDLLTKSFRNSKTNYTTINGLDLYNVLEKKYEGISPGETEVQVTHKTIGGKPVQYLTLKDKDGNVLGNEYIVPKVGGIREMKQVAESILLSKPQGSEDWYIGKEMLVNSTYLPEIQKVNLDSGGIKKIYTGDNTYVSAEKVTDNNVTFYKIYDVDGKTPLIDPTTNQQVVVGSEEELAEMIFDSKNKKK